MKLWKSLKNLKTNGNEFSEAASVWEESAMSRRTFLQTSAAGLALAGLSACSDRRKIEKIIPYIKQPEELVSGPERYYASAHILQGYANPVLVKSSSGRPIKVEANPEHPASLGTATLWDQAYLLGAYDSTRSQNVKYRGQNSSWQEFKNFLGTLEQKSLHIIMPANSSPTLKTSLENLRRSFSPISVIEYSPLRSSNQYLGHKQVFGEALEPLYHFTQADLVVSFDADFLFSALYPARYARDFMSRRRPEKGETRNTLFMVEGSPTLTGANADERLALRPSEIAEFVRAFANDDISRFPPVALLKKRIAKAQKTLFLAGAHLAPWIHALCAEWNAAYAKDSIEYIAPILPNTASTDEIKNFVQSMASGQVENLLLLGVDSSCLPFDFVPALQKVRHSIELAPYENANSYRMEWHLPESHLLEAWIDGRAFDGSLTIAQPLLTPLFDTKNNVEVLDLFCGKERDSRSIVEEHYQQKWSGQFHTSWQKALEEGFIAKSASPKISPRLKHTATVPVFATKKDPHLFELALRPDYRLLDGCFAKNTWLQELPDPLTQYAWGQAVLASPKTAVKLGAQSGDLLRLTRDTVTIEAPLWIQPGHSEGSLSFTFCDEAFKIFTGEHFEFVGVSIAQKNAYRFAIAEETVELEGEDAPIEFLPVSELSHKPIPSTIPLSLYAEDPIPSSQYAWGMAIDLSRCTGCQACVIACQAENNIPSVGAEGVREGRRMHWLRIDRYFHGTEDNPDIHFQPVPCMHCEKAPCEPVCPVAATVHNDEGLNQMVYNRCVGTRYCSNNCPYKVRRFNFLTYNHKAYPENLQKNPDVSVRTRGVMEKCTYCVQRINRVRIGAEMETRKIQDREVRTACEQACPTDAIRFGNILDPNSEVSQWKKKLGNYDLLRDQGTRPRTSYLAKVKGEKNA